MLAQARLAGSSPASSPQKGVSTMNLNKLLKKYPTKEVLLEARSHYDSWAHMAASLCLSNYTLYDLRKTLGLTPDEVEKRKGIDLREITQKQIDERMVEFKSDYNVYDSYQIVDREKFFGNTLGNEGLEYRGKKHGKTYRNFEYSSEGVEI